MRVMPDRARTAERLLIIIIIIISSSSSSTSNSSSSSSRLTLTLELDEELDEVTKVWMGVMPSQSSASAHSSNSRTFLNYIKTSIRILIRMLMMTIRCCTKSLTFELKEVTKVESL